MAARSQYPEVTQFVIEDRSDAVAVDGADANLALENDHEQIAPSGVMPSDPYHHFIEQEEIYFFDDEGVSEAHRVKFVEQRIEPGDEIHVAGATETLQGGPDTPRAVINSSITKSKVEHPFIISDSSIEKFESQ